MIFGNKMCQHLNLAWLRSDSTENCFLAQIPKSLILKWARQQISLSGLMSCSDDTGKPCNDKKKKKLNQTNVTSDCKLVKLVQKFTFFWKFCPSTRFVDFIPWLSMVPLGTFA